MSSSPDWTPSACTLPTPERPVRSAEFDRLFRSLIDVDRPSATALRLVVDGTGFPVETVADLAARESQCCSFFTFVVEGEFDTVTMDVTVAEAHTDVLDALQARAQSVSESAA